MPKIETPWKYSFFVDITFENYKDFKKAKSIMAIMSEEFKILGQSIPPEILGSNKNFYQAKACQACGDTGYFDRMGIYEILEMSDEIRSAILRRADSSEIKEIAVKNGMKTLLKDGFQKAVDGLTTIEEILRVVKD